jgi:hypothetical protein
MEDEINIKQSGEFDDFLFGKAGGDTLSMAP